MATVRSRLRCTPLYTAPIPPRAMKAVISYCGSSFCKSATLGGCQARSSRVTPAAPAASRPCMAAGVSFSVAPSGGALSGELSAASAIGE